MLTGLGFILLITPFILVCTYRDRVAGFVRVFISIACIHSALALITQVFHIFTYPVIVSAHSVIALSCLIYFFYTKSYLHIKKIKVNWLVVLGFLIVIFELWSVHFFYSGVVTTIKGFQYVEHSSYAYPLFSDEWIGVSLSQYAIDHHSLPLVNPLYKNIPFHNPLIVFFSLTSELMLLLHVDPLTAIAYFAIICGLLIGGRVYLLLRGYKISSFSALCAVLCLPYIVNGANIPGLWFYLPFIMGLIFFLTLLISFQKGMHRVGFVAGALTLLVYAPFILFVLSVCGIYLFEHRKKFQENILMLIALAIPFVFIVILLMIQNHIKNLGSLMYQFILRDNITGGTMSFPLWYVIPWVLLPFIAGGMIYAWKKQYFYLIAPVIVGYVVWIVDAFTSHVFIMEYARVVIITAVLSMICLGFGVEWLLGYVPQRSQKVIQVFVLICVVVLACIYPRFNGWRHMVLSYSDPHTTYAPPAPVNRYVDNDDIRIFSSLHNERFVAPPWKGLIIGVMTDNIPLETKGSTITNYILPYDAFMSADCSRKVYLTDLYHVRYVYSTPFSCDGFVAQDMSREGLTLYRYEQSS